MTMCTCSVSSSIDVVAADRLGWLTHRHLPGRADLGERRRDQLQRLVVVDRAGERDDHRAGVIVRFEETADIGGA